MIEGYRSNRYLLSDEIKQEFFWIVVMSVLLYQGGVLVE